MTATKGPPETPLVNLFGGYLHEDWNLEYPSVDAAIEDFMVTSGAEYVALAHAQLLDLLLECRDEPFLQRKLDEYHCSYAPTRDGRTALEWLTKVEQQLRA